MSKKYGGPHPVGCACSTCRVSRDQFNASVAFLRGKLKPSEGPMPKDARIAELEAENAQLRARVEAAERVAEAAERLNNFWGANAGIAAIRYGSDHQRAIAAAISAWRQTRPGEKEMG